MESYTMTKAWSPIVAPALAGVAAGVRPQGGMRHLDAPVQTSPITGRAFEAAAVGHRPWSPPIT